MDLAWQCKRWTLITGFEACSVNGTSYGALGEWLDDGMGLVWFCDFGLMGVTVFFYWVAFELHVCIFDISLAFFL